MEGKKNYISNETDLKVKGTDIGIEVISETNEDCIKDGYIYLRNRKLPNLIKRSKAKTFIILFILETRKMTIIEVTPDMEKDLEKNKTKKYNKDGYNLDISKANFKELKSIKEQVYNNFPVHKEEKQSVFIYSFIHTVLDRFTGKPVLESVSKYRYV